MGPLDFNSDDADEDVIELEIEDGADDAGGRSLSLLIGLVLLAVATYLAYRALSSGGGGEFTEIELDAEERTTVE